MTRSEADKPQRISADQKAEQEALFGGLRGKHLLRKLYGGRIFVSFNKEVLAFVAAFCLE